MSEEVGPAADGPAADAGEVRPYIRRDAVRRGTICQSFHVWEWKRNFPVSGVKLITEADSTTLARFFCLFVLIGEKLGIKKRLCFYDLYLPRRKA